MLKGEKSSTVEYWQWTEKKRNEQGEMVEVKLEIPRCFMAHVFNFQQAEHLPEFKIEPPSWDPCEVAERILKNSGADIRYDQTDTAFYSPLCDQIKIPARIAFPDAASFVGTALHELGHWTSAESRLNRKLGTKFGSPEYATEELYVEISAWMTCQKLGLPHDPERHVAYIGSWIQALNNDHNLLHRASKEAEKISEYILQFQHEKTLTTEVGPRKPSEKAAEALSFLKNARKKSVEFEC